jgi:hypothetical protein
LPDRLVCRGPDVAISAAAEERANDLIRTPVRVDYADHIFLLFSTDSVMNNRAKRESHFSFYADANDGMSGSRFQRRATAYGRSRSFE